MNFPNVRRRFVIHINVGSWSYRPHPTYKTQFISQSCRPDEQSVIRRFPYFRRFTSTLDHGRTALIQPTKHNSSHNLVGRMSKALSGVFSPCLPSAHASHQRWITVVPPSSNLQDTKDYSQFFKAHWPSMQCVFAVRPLPKRSP